jgi:hypothetical protein
MQAPQYHLVTSSHNVAPWKFPKYYPEPFMKMINEDHVHFTAEIRMANGEMLSACDLSPVSFHHDSKDIAVLHLLDETAALNGFQQLGFKMLDIEDYKASEDEVTRLSIKKNMSSSTTCSIDIQGGTAYQLL